jgi:PAS domain S-box-containing protein
VARHCAFLLGRGRVAGDASAQPLSVEQALALLKETMPAKEDLPEYLSALKETPAPLGDWPDFDSDLGRRFRVACAVVFLTPGRAAAWWRELLRLLGPQRYEQLMLFLAFVRTAHFWTEVHPELAFEPDLVATLREHEALVGPLLRSADEAARWELGRRLHDEMQSLRESLKNIEAIRESEGRLRAIFDNAAVGIARVEPDGRWLEVNRRFCDIVGYTRDELMTKAFGDITHPDDLDADWNQARRLLAGEIENYTMEKRYYRKDGSIVWANLTRSLARKADGSPDYFITVLEDISARKWAEEKLREREERFRILADTAPVMIWISGTDRLCTFFNKPWLDFTGRAMEEELGAGWTKGVHPDDYHHCMETYVTSFDSREPFEMEYRLRRYDGEYRWILDHGVPRFSPGGDFLGYIGSCIDITERKKVEEALSESEQRFARFMRHLPGLAWIKDLQGRYVYANAAAVKAFRRPLEELYGRKDDEIFPPEVAAQFKENDQQALTNEEGVFVVETLEHEDGVLHYSAVRKFPIPGQDVVETNIGGIAIDITGSKRADEARRESEERLAGIVSSAMDAIITVDDEQRIVLFNEAAERMFGCPAAEALGQPLNRFIPERFRSAHTEYVQRFGETGGTSRAMGRLSALAALRADGSEFPIEAAISSIEVGGRKLYTVIHRDITERKQAEAEREKLAQEQIARAAAEAANRSKDEFLAMVSHELRSPLNSILGYTRMLRSGPVDRDAINNVVAIVERSAKAQLQIIEDLLDSARIITGKLRIEAEPIDLVAVLEAALDTVRPAAQAKDVTLGADFGPTPEEALGDPTRLQQVVWNLLTNAVKFTPEGGRVELKMECDAKHIRIIVSDNGKGIEPEFLPFVFDRFRQADLSGARRYGGLGLGLSLVKHLVELHGGTITAESEGAGQGSTFTVTLPCRHLESIPPPPAVTPREVRTDDSIPMGRDLSLEGVRALVVDDQEDARELLIKALSEYGAQVTAVSSGAEALAFLSNLPGGKRPDALILDLVMPEEDGYTVLKKVRALEAAQGAAAGQIPAIALTAYGRSENRLRALQAGFQMHVAKPVEPAELALVIASLTTRRA